MEELIARHQGRRQVSVRHKARSHPRRRALSWHSDFTVGGSNLKGAMGIQFDSGQRVSPALDPQRLPSSQSNETEQEIAHRSGAVGLQLDVGDKMHFNGEPHRKLRVAFGPFYILNGAEK